MGRIKKKSILINIFVTSSIIIPSLIGAISIWRTFKDGIIESEKATILIHEVDTKVTQNSINIVNNKESIDNIEKDFILIEKNFFETKKNLENLLESYRQLIHAIKEDFIDENDYLYEITAKENVWIEKEKRIQQAIDVLNYRLNLLEKKYFDNK